uniref:Uncharacterized protein n=1 Tax=Lactuca sativa TaxID=4236 RepID=A0A9R1VSX8_LACSA|nr:hypothetical protein LSAT_V11C400162790 [Lactuca sativa]
MSLLWKFPRLLYYMCSVIHLSFSQYLGLFRSKAGYLVDDLEEILSDPLPRSITHPHQRLLMVLSNLGFYKDDLSREMHDKYKHIWMQSRLYRIRKTVMKMLKDRRYTFKSIYGEALLQQVMSLTPDQVNKLPSDQRNHVLQLQQMLRLINNIYTLGTIEMD